MQQDEPGALASRAMELYVETLTGTAFELRVSPMETVMSVKARIQRMEGIPIAQQHLVWKSKELKDDYCLQDYHITDGSTIKLVLALRGGPINTRRIAVEDSAWKEMVEYMEANREDIWEKLPGGKQVTLLVFRDGDQINFLRVIDRTDGSLSPLAESLGSSSIKSLSEDDQDALAQERFQENAKTEQKMLMLRQKMDALNLKKKPKGSSALSQHNNRHPSKGSAHFLVVKPKIQNPGFSLNKHLRLPPVNSHYISSTAKPRMGADDIGLGSASKAPMTSTNDLGSSLPKVSCTDSVDCLLDNHVNVLEVGTVPKHKNYSLVTNTARTVLNSDTSSIAKLETTMLPLNSDASDPELDARLMQKHAYSSNMSNSMAKPLHAEAKPPCVSLPSLNLSATGRRLAYTGSKCNTVDANNLQSTLAKLDPRIVATASGVHGRVTIGNRHDKMLLSSSLSLTRHQLERFPELCNRDVSSRPKTSPDKLVRSASERVSRSQATKDWLEVYNKLRTKVNSQRSLVVGTRELGTARRPMENDFHRSQIKIKERRERLNRHITSEGEKSLPTDVSHIPEEFAVQASHLNPRIPITPQKLPPVNISSTINSTVIPRCRVCKKKTGLATTYTCRCGGRFCAVHRYAETHGCTYDYKTEGRRLLEQANPMVAAPKLPKI